MGLIFFFVFFFRFGVDSLNTQHSLRIWVPFRHQGQLHLIIPKPLLHLVVAHKKKFGTHFPSAFLGKDMLPCMRDKYGVFAAAPVPYTLKPALRARFPYTFSDKETFFLLPLDVFVRCMKMEANETKRNRGVMEWPQNDLSVTHELRPDGKYTVTACHNPPRTRVTRQNLTTKFPRQLDPKDMCQRAHTALTGENGTTVEDYEQFVARMSFWDWETSSELLRDPDFYETVQTIRREVLGLDDMLPRDTDFHVGPGPLWEIHRGPVQPFSVLLDREMPTPRRQAKKAGLKSIHPFLHDFRALAETHVPHSVPQEDEDEDEEEEEAPPPPQEDDEATASDPDLPSKKKPKNKRRRGKPNISRMGKNRGKKRNKTNGDNGAKGATTHKKKRKSPEPASPVFEDDDEEEEEAAMVDDDEEEEEVADSVSSSGMPTFDSDEMSEALAAAIGAQTRRTAGKAPRKIPEKAPQKQPAPASNMFPSTVKRTQSHMVKKGKQAKN